MHGHLNVKFFYQLHNAIIQDCKREAHALNAHTYIHTYIHTYGISRCVNTYMYIFNFLWIMLSGYERQLLPKKYTPYILGCQNCYWCSFLWLGARLPLRRNLSPHPSRVSIQVCAAKLADSIQEEVQKKKILMDSSDFVTVFVVQKFGTLTFQIFLLELMWLY